MSKCQKCGKTYYTRECLNCRDNKINTKNTNEYNHIIKYIILAIVSITTITITIFFNMNSNPLIGKWKIEKNTLMGMEKIEFTKDKMIMMGIVSKVDYEIDKNKIFVTDEMGIGMVFTLINENTLYSEMMGMKRKYKKIQ